MNSSISNPYMNLATFTAVRCMLPKSGLDIKDVGIISGGVEGLFAWITTNFLMTYIQKREHPTVGALDMGGASTQISFEVPAENAGSDDVYYLRLYGEDYYVYSVTYLCYGITEIYRRYLALSVGDDPGRTDIIADHCTPDGYESTYTADYLFNQPCTTTETYKDWMVLNRHSLNKTYLFRGSGKVKECKNIIAQLFSHSDCSGKFRDCFSPVKVKATSETFMAFSTFFYTMTYFNSTDTQKVSKEAFQTKLDEFCKLQWDIAKTVITKGADSEYIYRYCFQGQAVAHLLGDGYRFNETTWPNLNVTKKIGSVDVGWSLGYMINATNAIPAELPNPPIISLALFIILLLICVILLILVIVFLKRHRASKKSAVPSA